MPVEIVRGFPRELDEDSPVLVGQREWCCLIPRLHRALANPGDVTEFPGVPHASAELSEFCAYWETLYYLLKSLLSWADLGKGLLWWYSAGKPTLDDPRLELVRQIWDYENQLDLFAAWTWKNRSSTWDFSSGGERVECESLDPGSDWWRDFERRFPPDPCTYTCDPFHGGSNVLHLGYSSACNAPERQQVQLTRTSTARRRAVLMLTHASGWQVLLEQQDQELPDIGERSWHVDVVVKPMGWLGTFRRSRVSQRWFQGRHSLHMQGNAESGDEK